MIILKLQRLFLNINTAYLQLVSKHDSRQN